MSWVEVQGFSYTYPGELKPALSGINLTIQKNDFIVISGASGSGKSTLGKALAGFLFQDEEPNFEGKIIVNQTDMTQIPLFKASERVAYVQQNPEDQFCTLTVLDEIAFALENACLPPEEIDQRIDQSLEVVNSLNLRDRLLATLSGGEKQKIAIASMLALKPDVLILDEPTSNLDPNATQHIFETLHYLRNQNNLTVIIIEHKLSQLLAFNPKFVFIDHGKIISNTPLKSLKFVPVTPEPQDSKQASSQSNPTLEITDLVVCIEGHKILQDFNLSLYPGEFVAIIGPNGSGKSTLLQTIMGFHKPAQGKLTGFGKDITQTKTSALVDQMSFIFQNPDHQLFTQSVWDEATLTLKNLNLLSEENKAKAHALLSTIGLEKRLEDHPQRLSYGEKRRLNLLAVILHNPQILLIDELLIGQDMQNAVNWMEELRTYANRGNTILLVNHHADLTRAFCDRVVFLDQGKKILDQPISTAFKELAQKGLQAFLPQMQEGFINA